MSHHGGLTTSTGALRWRVATLSLVVALLLAVGLSVGYSYTQQRASDRRWCALMQDIDQPAPAGQPESARSAEIRARIHELRLQLRC